MAVSSLPCTLLLLLLISFLDGFLRTGAAFLSDWEHRKLSAPHEPHVTGCVSREMETFSCSWSPGAFHNLSAPGALRFFYIKKDPSGKEDWKDCPHYESSNRECFFDANHTSVWLTYCVQLRSQNVTYDNEDCFKVEYIVRPDPPVSLNWTLLNISPSWVSYDVMVKWKPPPSADLDGGWISLLYQMEYREKNATKWKALEVHPRNQQTIFGLHIGKEYEAHIRSKMQGFNDFGEFSDPIAITLSEVDSQETTFLFTIVVVFGVLGILILVMLIVVSQQHRFMMILLPPVPAPKIKGIDPEMLKKGKLDELNLILGGRGMGGLSTYLPEFYQDEPWVEFIEVDTDDAEDKEENQGSDTQRLLALPQPISHPMNIGSSNAISFPDDDSGRASCYDPDLLDHDTAVLTATLLPGQPEDDEASLNVPEGPASSEKSLVQTKTPGPQTWVNTDFYAQVSNVMPSGGVVLSPGQQPRSQDSVLTVDAEETKKKGNHIGNQERNEEKEPKEQQFELLVVDPEGSGYATECKAQRIGTSPISSVQSEGYQAIPPEPVETKQAAAAADDNQSPYIGPEFPLSQFCAPVSDYTVVQEVDMQHSLLLNPPPPLQSSPPCLPQQPPKSLPAMPVGYVTPDLLGNLSP